MTDLDEATKQQMEMNRLKKENIFLQGEILRLHAVIRLSRDLLDMGNADPTKDVGVEVEFARQQLDEERCR